MYKLIRAVAIIAVLSTLGACASMDGHATPPGVFNGLGSEVMPQIVLARSDFNRKTGANAPTWAQYLAVQEAGEDIGIQVDWQLSSGFEAATSEAVPYLGAGAIGGATQGIAYAGADAGAGALVSGVTYMLGGAVNGLVTASYANVSAKAKLLEDAIRDKEADGMKIFHNLHVAAAYIRSRNNTNSPAPELAKHMPDFSGPPTAQGQPAH